MKRVLITGANGFVGRHCCAELCARGFDVHGVYSLRSRFPVSQRAEDTEIQRHAVDLFDEMAVKHLVQRVRPTHLLHLAWITTPGEYWNSPENLAWTSASLHLLRTFGESGGERAVMTGSCAEYDWQSGYCTENVTPLRPTSLYGHSKHAVQELLKSYAGQVGLSFAWARLFFLYGPHASSRRLPGAVIEPLLRGEPAHCSTGECLRDFLYIDDAAGALAAVVDSDLSGAVNIASGKPVVLKDLIRTTAQLIGREDLLMWGGHPNGHDAPVVVGDVRRLKDELSWSPSVSLHDGLLRTIDWWRTFPGEYRAVA